MNTLIKPDGHQAWKDKVKWKAMSWGEQETDEIDEIRKSVCWEERKPGYYFKNILNSDFWVT